MEQVKKKEVNHSINPSCLLGLDNFQCDILKSGYQKKSNAWGNLRIVSATYLLVRFLSLSKTTCQTKKNVFYFTSKALFVLEKIKSNQYHFMTSSNAWVSNKKYILLNYLGSKDSLLMKFDQFLSYCKRNNFIKIFYKICDLETISRPSCVCRELSATSVGKRNLWSHLFILDM